MYLNCLHPVSSPINQQGVDLENVKTAFSKSCVNNMPVSFGLPFHSFPVKQQPGYYNANTGVNIGGENRILDLKTKCSRTQPKNIWKWKKIWTHTHVAPSSLPSISFVIWSERFNAVYQFCGHDPYKRWKSKNSGKTSNFWTCAYFDLLHVLWNTELNSHNSKKIISL